jgi:hypothetical protein
MKTLLCSLAILCGLFSVSVATGTPAAIDYQGFLRNTETGMPLNGPHDLVFRLYGSITGPDSLWSETHPGVTLDQGVFSVQLGSVHAFSLPMFEQGALFLEVNVDAQIMTPRTQLVSVPYALFAQVAQQAAQADSAGFAAHAAYADSSGDSGAGSDAYWAQSGDDLHNTNAGKVGIGTSTPASRLNYRSMTGDHDDNSLLYQSINPSIRLDAYAAGNHSSEIRFLKAGQRRWSFVNDIFGNDRQTIGFYDWQRQTHPFMIDENGRVGIGLTNPGNQLQVAGTIQGSQLVTDRMVLGNGGTGAVLSPDNLTFDGSYGYAVGDQFVQFNAGYNPDLGGQGLLGRITGWRTDSDYDRAWGRLKFTLRSGAGSADVVQIDPTGVLIQGSLCVTGQKNRIVETPFGPTKLNAVESAEAWFTKSGEGHLTDGRARVTLSDHFRSTVTISPDRPLQVDVTFYGPHGNSYVERDLSGFTVIDPSGSNAEFSWRASGRQKGYEDWDLKTDADQAER